MVFMIHISQFIQAKALFNNKIQVSLSLNLELLQKLMNMLF
jgi:hypothetical protein